MAKMSKNDENLNNPYLFARREWNERYGDYIARAKTWRMMAMASLGVAAIAVATAGYVVTSSKVKPFVVEVDKTGEVRAVGIPDVPQTVSERIIKASLVRWIDLVRRVPIDPEIKKDDLTYVYAMASSETAQKLNAFFKQEENDPFAIIGKGYVISTDIKNVVKLRDNIYQIDWDEKTVDTRDQRYKIDHMRAVITVATKEPTTEQDILKNPLGIYVIDFNWSPIMSFDSN